ncbi:MAG: hypothetical protein OEV44_12000 [Spirochaetota bacterium]|nr:hypothetical protein [Spirochaetota bacterium]
MMVASKVKGSRARDNFLYYFHPDHLGSTQYVTEANGAVYEHVEYFPFGVMKVGGTSSKL